MRKTIIACILPLIAGADLRQAKAQSYTVYLESFNSSSADFAPAFLGDKLLFCSNRNQKIHKNDRDSLQKYRTDLFVVSPGSPEESAELFSKEITTWLNEGPATFSPDGNTVYYSGNIEPENLTRKDKVKVYKLGIFKAVLNEGIWVPAEPFPYNSTNNKYDLAHPSLSADGQTMFFGSNKDGGLGGSDIYYSRLVNGMWSEPMNLGASVNTPGNELFPYVDAEGRLFFSSNGYSEAGDMDVYYSVLKPDGTWRKAMRLPEPVNSGFDDFSFIRHASGEYGFLSSNRSDGQTDNIYGYQFHYPVFSGCSPVQLPNYCYLFEEKEIEGLDSLPLKYEWSLGDGSVKKGISVQHCYSEPGLYSIYLNIVDTITGLKYSEVASLELEIERRNQPNIDSRDTIRAGEYFELTALDEDLRMFDLEEWYWDMGDGTMRKGKSSGHSYTKPGVYRITLGAISYPSESTGKRSDICVYKEIVVLNEDTEFIADRDDFADPVYTPVSDKANMKTTHFLPPEGMGTFYVEVLRSEERVPYNAPVFNKVAGEITERYLKEEGVYTYSVGEIPSVAGVYDIFRSLADSGYVDLKVNGDVLENFELQTMKKGNFISKDDTTAINREFYSLRNIKFAYNSEEILEESFANLNYLISMLEVEPSYRIAINSHTDNIGSDGFNQKLSERRADAVVDYFVRAGIRKERMAWKGYGAAQPVADNSTEEGRAENRRVEFMILDTQKTAEK